ncbi:MAG: hypothetical protein JW838_04975 [Spirochaetes bacterium]|nr:hypothetical protein [Spirochaetota bacterium]
MNQSNPKSPLAGLVKKCVAVASALCMRAYRLWRRFDYASRHRAVTLLRWETEELQNIFGLAVLGFLAGFPSAPMHIALELLPEMKEELPLMIECIGTAHDPLGQLFSLLDIG